jgi:hypothetical protein
MHLNWIKEIKQEAHLSLYRSPVNSYNLCQIFSISNGFRGKLNQKGPSQQVPISKI